MFTVLKKEQLFDMLLSTIPINDKGTKPLTDYDRCMFHLLYNILHTAFTYQQQDIISFSLKSVFPKISVGKQSSIMKVYTTVLTMCALSSNQQTNSL
jgi:hypothetical protein